MLSECKAESNSEARSSSAWKGTILQTMPVTAIEWEAHMPYLLSSTGFGGQSRSVPIQEQCEDVLTDNLYRCHGVLGIAHDV